MTDPGNTFVANQGLFVQALRRSGITVSTTQALDHLRALTLIDLGDREQVFHAGRSLLVSRQLDLPLFEAIFDHFWLAAALPAPPRPKRRARRPVAPNDRQRFNVVSYRDFAARRFDAELEVDDRSHAYSADESLATRRFADLAEHELDAVRRQILATQWQVAERRTRRYSRDRTGTRLDLRAVLRDAARHDGAPARLHFRRRKVKPRPVVALADVSGSMERYARLLLLFLHTLVRGAGEVEAFVFGTRLTRLTEPLGLRNVDRAVAEAARRVLDWSGGTRIGDSLAAFNRQWSRRVLRRGAVVVIVSDGCERGDVTVLEREMRFLQHRCFRLVWLNPHAGASSYRPRVEGMSVALRHVDDFLPIGNLSDLEQLASHLASLPVRRGARRAGATC